MKLKAIEKNGMSPIIEELIKEHEVYAPVEKKGIIVFERISSGSEICLDFQNTRTSPKEVFLPQTEILFTYRMSEKKVQLEETHTPRKTVLLGLRPCDAQGFILLDKFFSTGEHKDKYYLERRRNTTTIGLACNHPLTTCFCTSLGCSPHGREGLDLLLQDINDKYIIEAITEKGVQLIERFPQLEDAEESDVEKAKSLSTRAEGSMKPEVSIEDLNKKLDTLYDDPLWNQIQQKCIGCGICTYLCPTCSCFDVLDEETDDWKRVRTWDSCQFPCFTLHGSGHNPRPSGKERMRQRIMHKFSYFPKNHGETLCVGCGRCVQECPVNLDIREVIKAISVK